MRSNIRVPLPKGWPRTIRSAVIHAISLAQFSLTHTRSWAANSWNARIRLKQENDSCRSLVEVSERAEASPSVQWNPPPFNLPHRTSAPKADQKPHVRLQHIGDMRQTIAILTGIPGASGPPTGTLAARLGRFSGQPRRLRGSLSAPK